MSAKDGDNVVLAIVLSLVALVLFQSMGLVIKHLSPRFSAPELSAWRNFFGLFPSAIALATSRSWHRNGRPWRLRQPVITNAKPRALSTNLRGLAFVVPAASPLECAAELSPALLSELAMLQRLETAGRPPPWEEARVESVDALSAGCAAGGAGTS